MSSALPTRHGFALIVVLLFWSTPLSAAQQCWVAEISLVSFVYEWRKFLGPFPDNESILSAAQNEARAATEEKCGGITSLTIVYSFDSDTCQAGVCVPRLRYRDFYVFNEPNQCSGLFHYLGRNAALDAIPPPICSDTYSIRLTSNTSTESPDVLATMEPDKSTNLVAKVYDQNNQLVPNVGVRLTLKAKQDSGGHHHPDNTVAARTGTMQGQQELAGNTGPSGQGFSFTYDAPGVSGDIDILATCTGGKNCTPQGPKQVWVGYKGLQPVGDNAVYRLIPNAAKDPGHPDNHYLTLTAASRLAVFASLYHAKYPDLAVLHLNDASLERGGIFDLKHNWRSPHWEHCRGTVIDIRANGAEGALNVASEADPVIKKISQLGNIAGVTPNFEIPKDQQGNRIWEARHFHTYLVGQEGLQCP